MLFRWLRRLKLCRHVWRLTGHVLIGVLAMQMVIIFKIELVVKQQIVKGELRHLQLNKYVRRHSVLLIHTPIGRVAILF